MLDWPLCHCAVAQAPPFDEHRRAPWPLRNFLDVWVTEKNSIIAVVPCYTPLVVMITKLSLIGIISNNGNNFS